MTSGGSENTGGVPDRADEKRVDATRVFPSVGSEVWTAQPPPQYQPQQPWTPPQASKPKSNRLLVILTIAGLVGLAAIVILVTAVIYLGGSKKLDQHAAEAGVKKVLTSDYAVQNVGDVKCPSDITVSADTTFECTVVVGSDTMKVTSKFTNDNGTYEVGRPS